MQSLLFTFFASLIVLNSNAQCVNFFQDTLVTCNGSPVTFNGIPSSALSIPLATVDFNTASLPAGWSTSGGTNFTQVCGSGSDNTPYFWSSTSGSSVAFLQSAPLDLTNGVYLSFDFLYALPQGPPPCEGPQIANEGVSVQYSTNGGLTWYDIVYYSPSGVELGYNTGGLGSAPPGPTQYNSWSTIDVLVPAAAMTPSTSFRWIQEVPSAACCNNWGLDNININFPGQNFSYQWDTGATTLSLTESSNVDTTFYLTVTDTNNNFLCMDSVHLQIAGPGFDNGIQTIIPTLQQGQFSHLFVDAYNNGCPSQSGEIVIKLDTLLSFVYSTPSPNVVTNDSLIYYFSNLYQNGPHEQISMYVQTSTSAMIGDTVHVGSYITPSAGDVDPNNNFKDYFVPVVASYDPNDKQVYPQGDCDVGYITNDQLMTYTVRFQNTGTAPAIDVRVNDILDSNLDPSTLKVVAASHDYFLEWVAPNNVDFKFDNINLPAQVQDDLGSNGYIVFEIEQLQGLPHGTSFSNYVDIYFDFNAPITTNTVLNTVTDGSHAPVGDTLVINAQSAYNWNGQLLTSSGIYTQLFPLPDGCDSTAILSLILESDAGLNVLSENPFVIYPNPTTNHLIVKGTQEGILRLKSASGAIVLEQKILGNSTIKWSDLSAGVYVVEIESDNRFYREKLIIRE